MRGLRWKVGDGQNINVWNDPWLPRPWGFKLITPKIEDLEDLEVSSLIDRQTRTWDLEILQQIFLPQDVETICSIPISVRNAEDTVIWHFHPRGEFTVNSAYKAEMNWREQVEKSEGSNSEGNQQWMWKQFWKVKIPEKIKIFGWRVIRDILPTRSNLSKRKIPILNSCPGCDEVPESIFHSLWECEIAQEVWKVAGLNEKIKPTNSHCCKIWFAELLDRLPADLFQWFLIVTWFIWHYRNQLVFKGEGQTASRIDCQS